MLYSFSTWSYTWDLHLQEVYVAATPQYPAYQTLTRDELIDQRNLLLDAAEQALADVGRDGGFASEVMLGQGNLAASIALVYTGIIAELDRRSLMRIQRDSASG